jgi:hypothetical protein
MKTYFTIAILLCTLFFAGCDMQTAVDIDLPEHAPRLVVNAVLKPGEAITVSVTKSRHILEPDMLYESVSTAQVLLTSNGVERQLIFDHTTNTYSFPEVVAEAGTSYELLVKAAGFKDASSKMAVENFAPIISIEKGGKAMIEQDYPGRIYYVTIQDDPAKTNFYRLRIDDVYDIHSADPAFSNEFTTDGLLFDDAVFNGREVRIPVLIPEWFETQPSLMFRLDNLNEELFTYLETEALHRNTQGDPFAQPVTVYSNVTNGFGIFGGYAQWVQEFVQ